MRFNPKILLICALPAVDAFAVVLQGPILSLFKILVLIVFFGPLQRQKSGYSYLFVSIILALVISILIQSFNSTFLFTSFTLSTTVRIILSLTVIHWVYINVNHPVYSVKNWGKSYFVIMFLSSCSSLIGGYVFGVGGVIPGRSSYFHAQKGFFIGANEVGLIILISAFFCFLYYGLSFERYAKIKRLLVVCLTVIISIIPLTKSSLLAGFLLVIYYISKTSLFMKIISSLLIATIIWYYWALILFVINNSFILALLQGTDGENFSRGRDKYADAIMTIVTNGSEHIGSLFTYGVGFSRIKFETSRVMNVSGGTTFERDVMDLFIGYGPFISVAVLMFLFVTMLGSGFFKAKSAFIVVFCVFGHSVTAGHVIFSSQVLIPLFVYIIYWGAAQKAGIGSVIDKVDKTFPIAKHSSKFEAK